MTQGFKASVASELGSPSTLLVEKVYWFNPASIGDLVEIGDPISGLTLLNIRCEIADYNQIFDWTSNPRVWQDFEVGRIDSGTLYIYLR